MYSPWQKITNFINNISIRSKFIFSLLFFVLLFLIMLQRISLFQEKKIAKIFSDTKKEKIETFNKLFDLKAEHLEILIYNEYGQWDEMVNFVNKYDREFAKLNLDLLISEYDFNALWVYDTLDNQIYRVSDSTIIAPVINQELFSELLNKKHTIRYYDIVDNKYVEIIATLIYPSNFSSDSKHYGYLVTAQVIDENYISQLEELFESSITLSSVAVNNREDAENYALIKFSKPLMSFDNTPVGYLNVTLNSIIISESISSSRTLLFVYTHITLFILFIFIIMFVRFVSRPLKKITSSMDMQNTKELKYHASINDEFGKISNLILQFFDQKSELEKQIKQREIAETNLQHLNKLLQERVSIRTAELKALIEQAPLAIGIFDKKGVLIEYNRVYEELFKLQKRKNYNISQLSGLVFTNNPEYKAKLNDIMTGGGEFYTFPVNYNTQTENAENENEDQWLILRFYSIKPENSNDIRIVNIVEDISENKRMEETQKRLNENEIVSLAIYNAQEEERKRVSGELHDSIGQKLSSIQMKLEVYSKQNSGNSAQLDDIKSTIFDIGKELRNIIKALHPNDLDDYGLIKSLDLLCHEISNTTDIVIFFNKYDYPEKVDPVIELNIYRIVQEALNNIAKHSGATEASVQIYFRDDSIMVNIEDNGKGIDLGEDKKLEGVKMGFGLLNMKRRTETLQGNFYIDSSQSLGTEIQIKIPWGKNGKN